MLARVLGLNFNARNGTSRKVLLTSTITQEAPMPIKELLAITTLALAAIFAAHPFDFSNAVRKVELSILKEASRTDNWGNPSFSGTRKYNQRTKSRSNLK
jgi:hypothetical protein